MLIEDIQKICKKFPYVTEDIKWGAHLAFCIGEKMFMITSPDSSPISATFKVDEEDFALLLEKDGFSPATYVGRYKWITIDNINRLSKKQWEEYLKKAYSLIKDKLPQKKKRELGIG
ncbi:MAG: MmcQ/YjbR family DNA-binding protein [Chitinophagaceae bacterium]